MGCTYGDRVAGGSGALRRWAGSTDTANGPNGIERPSAMCRRAEPDGPIYGFRRRRRSAAGGVDDLERAGRHADHEDRVRPWVDRHGVRLSDGGPSTDDAGERATARSDSSTNWFVAVHVIHRRPLVASTATPSGLLGTVTLPTRWSRGTVSKTRTWVPPVSTT